MSAGVNFNAGLATISTETMRDVLKAVMDKYPYAGSLETLQKYPNYPMCRQIANSKVEQQGGTSCMFMVQNVVAGQARRTQAYTPDSVNVVDALIRGRTEWAEYTVNWAISREEMTMNSGATQIVNMVEQKRDNAMNDFADLIEEDSWALFTAGIAPNPLWGLPYWIVPIASGSTVGFNGAHASGHSNCGNISSTLWTRWKNYNDRWAAAASFTGTITPDDVTKLSRMLMELNFESPVFAGPTDGTPFDKMRLYTGIEVALGLEARARNNNDNLGNDVTRFAGATLINNLPVKRVPRLDATYASTYPLYAVNHTYLPFFVQAGWYLVETGPDKAPNQHNTVVTHVDLRGQFGCTNRQRLGGVLSAVAA